MYFSTALVVLASAFIPGVLSTCEDFTGGHTYCKWYGTAPACGTSQFEVGEWDGDEQLDHCHGSVTKRYSPRELLYYDDINEECYEDYGNTCFWKQLQEEEEEEEEEEAEALVQINLVLAHQGGNHFGWARS